MKIIRRDLKILTIILNHEIIVMSAVREKTTLGEASHSSSFKAKV
jgi:hypothetical protein